MTEIPLKGGHRTADQRLDRVPQHDPRNAGYPIRDIVGSPQLREKRWRLLERLDQGQEGACVGFGWSHEMAALPVHVPRTNEQARALYHRAQQLDDMPGENYSGTSVLAGAKAVQELGHLDEYRWAFSVDDVLATLVAHGPVVIGVNWYAGMFDTDPSGYVHVAGAVRGGHCVCLRGIVREHGRWNVLGRNSWGRAWGDAGDFKLAASDLEQLLAEHGDACVPVVRR